jgi:hypothetical protein
MINQETGEQFTDEELEKKFEDRTYTKGDKTLTGLAAYREELSDLQNTKNIADKTATNAKKAYDEQTKSIQEALKYLTEYDKAVLQLNDL